MATISMATSASAPPPLNAVASGPRRGRSALRLGRIWTAIVIGLDRGRRGGGGESADGLSIQQK